MVFFGLYTNQKKESPLSMSRSGTDILEAASSAALVIIVICLCIWSCHKVAQGVKQTMWRRSGYSYDNVEYTPKHLNCSFDAEHLQQGKEYFKKCKVVVCGLLRDKATRLKEGHVQRIVNRVVGQFNDYRVLIVENDSVDGTRDVLLNWSKQDPKIKILGCGVNAAQCVLQLDKTRAHSTFAPRINKMVVLRNEYMNALQDDPDLQDADFVVVTDLDLHAGLYLDGIWSTGYHFSQHPDWSAICANGLDFKTNWLGHDKMKYYDTYALRTEQGWNFRKRALDDMSVIQYPLRCAVSPQKIVSGFSGLTFYRMKEIKDLRYHLMVDQYGECLCEHISLNLQLPNMYIDPSNIFIIISNDL